ncbi:MAG TPA: sulfite exporter TauE/SafE family protein, partial [Salinimicrobium sp.]|nr:sulfite exporter TauE/SafE family protein [Salinimicrobium sp.]
MATKTTENKNRDYFGFTDGLSFNHIGISIICLKVLAICFFGYLLLVEIQNGTVLFDNTFWWFILAGFVAQIIDGALGMAYGVSCTTLLLNFGIPPSFASASVHTSEIFTSGVSGLSHLKFKNIDKKLFFKLVFTGVLGAVIGAFLISQIFDGSVIKPFVAAYLFILGGVILYKGIQNKKRKNKKLKHIGPLAFIGGLMDACGGGGWGPIVTSNLINQGNDPRKTVGTVVTAEFFVTFFATAIFIFFLSVQFWQIVIGLIIGGTIAAPIGAYLVTKVKKQLL